MLSSIEPKDYPIVLLKLVSSELVLCKICDSPEKGIEDSLYIQNPVILDIVPTGQPGQFGIAIRPYIMPFMAINPDAPFPFENSLIMHIFPVSEDLERTWLQTNSKIQLPKQGLQIVKS